MVIDMDNCEGQKDNEVGVLCYSICFIRFIASYMFVMFQNYVLFFFLHPNFMFDMDILHYLHENL